MSPEQVWYRFEGKKKDGTVLKLRIQDLPPGKLNDALDLIINFFAREEPVQRAVGIAKNSQAMEGYRKVCEYNMRSDPSYRTVICCADDTPDVTNLMGLSVMSLSTDVASEIQKKRAEAQDKPQEVKNLIEIFHEFTMSYNPLTQFNLDVYFEGKYVVVDPAYRGLGIAKSFLKVSRLVCESYGVKLMGGWMTAFGTQKAATREGWVAVKEIEYDYLAEKYGVTFTDVPGTMKFMIARA